MLEGQPLPPTADTGRPAGGRAPGNSESWFLRESMRYLAHDGVAGVVSFADPVPRIVAGRQLFAGHIVLCPLCVLLPAVL